KDRRYVQTDAALQAILIEAGLGGAHLRPAGTGAEAADRIEGERLRALVEIATGLDQALRAFGRRNLPLRPFLALAHPATGLPASSCTATARTTPSGTCGPWCRRSAASARRASRAPALRGWGRWTPSISGRARWIPLGGPSCRSVSTTRPPPTTCSPP